MKLHLATLFLKEYFLARRTHRFQTVAQLQRYQQKKLLKHLRKIVPHAPFYAQRFAGTYLEDWHTLPVMDKQVMMDHFDTLNTVGIRKEQAFQIALVSETSRDFSQQLQHITVGLSSGTSGNRGLFIISQQEQARWAGNILGKMLPESLFFGKKQKIAFFLRANSNLYTSVNNRKVAFQFFDLLEEISVHIERLNAYEPTLLIAPASMLVLLAKAKQDGLLHIEPIKVVSVAEALNKEDEQYIQYAFNQIVHQVYQCTEGFLAYTCTKGTLHINEDLVIIEKDYLDKEKGKFVPIITDFTRTSQPIIRYRLNDVLTEGTACDCGSKFMTLAQIDGRCDDLFYARRKNDAGLKIIFADFIRRAVITATDATLDYKVRQLSVEHIEIALDVQADRAAIEHRIQQNFARYFAEIACHLPIIQFVAYEAPQKGTKMRRVERCFDLEEVKK